MKPLIGICGSALIAGVVGYGATEVSVGPRPDLCPSAATGEAVRSLVALDTLMCRVLDSTGVRGGALAVTHYGRLVYARGFGVADESPPRPVQPTSLFRIASLSKPLTAVAVLELARRGRMDLHAPALDPLIRDLAPAARVTDQRVREITVQQLLQHTAGWDRYAHNWDPMFASDSIARAMNRPAPADLDAILAHTLGDSLQFTPGSGFAYSNVGYAFIGRLLERATGMPYDSVVQQYVLAPAGINRMRLGRTRPEDRSGSEVDYFDDRVVRAVFPDEGRVAFPDGGFLLEPMAAHGGWVASVIDLMRFLVRVDGLPSPPDLLDREWLTAMLTTTPASEDYGAGWYVERADPDLMWWHMGDLPGSRALLVRGTGGFGFAALFNGSPKGLHPGELRDRLLDVLSGTTTKASRDLFDEYP